MEEDKKYVETLKNGDYDSFDVLFRKYAERIYAFTLGITRQSFIAEEITQIVFLRIWEKRDKINEYYSFKSFLFSIAYHEIISWLRKEKSDKRKISGYVTDKDYLSQETEISIEFKNLEEFVNEIIAKFPDKRRQIYKMSREQGYSNKEIADKLDISVKTVENQMTSALKTLKVKLDQSMLLGTLFYFLFLQ